MSAFKNVTVKFDGMRKSQDFVIYPREKDPNTPEYWIIQSDTRIARVVANGQVMLSKARAGGANFVHLHPAMGAKLTEAPEGLVAELRLKETNSNVVAIIGGKIK
jgi:hypothetical protein